MNMKSLPLAGIKVIDYTHYLAGPYIGRCLAAMGAEVIKVERPSAGDGARTHPYLKQGQSGYFLQQNIGKKGLCINLKDARGLEVMNKLISTADVFIENYRPGSLNKLGLSYEDLCKINPSLVYGSVSAYGHTGPDSHKPGFGLIAEAKSGAMDLIGNPGEVPPLFRLPIADMFAGIHGVAAICAALVGRNSTGQGSHVDIALYDCMFALHEFAVQCYTLSDGKEKLERSGSILPQATVYGVFQGRDGYIAIAAQQDDIWRRFARLIGGEHLADDSRFWSLEGRNQNSELLLQTVRAWVSSQNSVSDCVLQLDAVDVPCAPVQGIDMAIADPQIKARGMLINQIHPVLGPIQLSNVPLNFSNTQSSQHTPAPMIGEHNDSILSSLGYTKTEIKEFLDNGVLYTEKM